MDTKQKTRSTTAGSRSRSAEQNHRKRTAASQQRRRTEAARTGSGAARRTENTRRSTEDTRRRSTQSAARNAQPAARSRQAATQQRTAPTARRAEPAGRTVQSDAPEMVFKTDAQPSGRIRTPEENKRAAQRRRSAKRTQERKKEAERAKKRPAVSYTQPKPLNWNRLLLQLAVVIAVVLAVVMGLSVFFKVDTVVVYGIDAYSAEMVKEAAGIEGGENLLTFGNTRACGKIMAALPYVEDVRIGIKLPDTVNIYITEYDVAYAIASEDGTWWLMTSGGKVVEQVDSGIAGGYTKVLGVELANPKVGEAAIAAEEMAAIAETTDATEATEAPPVLITGAARLNAAKQILESLELNDIVGEAASVDVTSLNNIELWYGQQYQVKLGDTNNMDYKISCMKKAISQGKEYDVGILDVSFTTFGDQVGFTAFE